MLAALLITLDLLVVAHRGASAVAPENTMAAFRAAGTAGADMYELDVRQTKDGQLVVVHDSTLARTTDVERLYPDRAPWRVSDFTLAEIKQLDAGSWFGAGFTGQRVPTVREAIAASSDGPGLVLEVKNPTKAMDAPLTQLLDELPSDTIVLSYDWAFLRRLQTHAQRATLGPVSLARLPSVAAFADLVVVRHNSISVPFVRRAHKLGIKVISTTVDRPAVMRRMLASGVDGMLTNRPRVARNVADMKPEFDELRNVIGDMLGR
ncbi:glycerophosphodiester phosphodiesterase [Nonomuraea soli]|uniref:Glycerophosphoryl diester phosphodiesterase n=1 Tax=Nonomuraea soli TaxID=1032476 RepID=A0A7W0CT59_9ACTN|nr:glycerophosphodiester phosphodiesterase family protein [Nonomuraea soli]MBA2896714.1 glycerophosphoryl diester phosphodiesterase [Nonomuraea soli]